jgi:Tol biopolymer transport system component
MRQSVSVISILLLLGLGGAATASDALRDPREVHLKDMIQLTFGGENAEGYWSPDGGELVYQATLREEDGGGCDQIYRIAADGSGEPVQVSTGEGRTTCAYFTYPDGDRILYATTHLDAAACPPPPDRSQGYVWALYPGYDIVSVAPDGSDLERWTDAAGYDAEATVCPLDGRVVFTSVRDGDLELYVRSADGSRTTRITDAPGYDGGAFFSPDCSKIVWRASRPRSEEELAEYRRLLDQGLIRPSRLELWVADADGSNASQITWYGGATFAPSFFPSGDRLIFSSNLGDPRGREFDLWAVDVDGAGLERITYTPEFDGFPLFSPDGTRLAFASNRFHERDGETNLFVARWEDGEEVDPDSGPNSDQNAGLPPERLDELRAPDRFRADVAWLADDAREGRGVGTRGLVEARDWLAGRFEEIGLEPAGEDGGFFQAFDVAVAVEVDAGTRLAVGGRELGEDEFTPAPFSASESASGPVVAAGYGIVAPELGIDDYAGLDVAGKLVAVRRFVPASVESDDDRRRYGDLRYKAFTAREKGAAGLLIVDLPEAGGPDEEEAEDDAPLPALTVESGSDAGLPVAVVAREAGRALFDGNAPSPIRAELSVRLAKRAAPAWNVVGRLPAGAAQDRGGMVILGAHYDHLGYGGASSLAPGSDEPHNGADDNASGTAALLEAARVLAGRQGDLRRDVVFAAFSGEETGILGSGVFVREPPPGVDVENAVAMINMDMVGRLRDRLTVLGTDSAQEWETLVPPLCADLELPCELGGDAYGPSDHTSFYAGGVPVLMLFTGVHDDYHRPSDDTEKINAGGGARIARLAADVATELAAREEPLTYRKLSAPAPRGDSRSGGASLGVVPDYAGEGGGEGMLLSDVRPDGPADQAGMRRDDRLVELAGHEIRDVHDLVYVLRQAKPGETVEAVVLRDGERIEMEVTFGESRRMSG